jgi:antitoxin (DNA-binding transcriptional repressor) of toxin-antitoxin stability system
MDEVQAKCETVIITKHGKPVAKLVPVDAERDEIFGFMKGKIAIIGDVVRPAVAAADWKRLK